MDGMVLSNLGQLCCWPQIAMRVSLRYFAFAAAAILITGAHAAYPDNGADAFFTNVGVVAVGNSWNGSGTVISNRDVLTAKHVGGSRFFMSNNGTTFFTFFDAIQRIEHPTADLAILRFSPGTFTSWHDIYEDDMVGQQTYMVGFGLTATLRANGTGWNHVPGSDLVRRSTTNMIDYRVAVNLGGGITNSMSIMYDIDNPAGGNGTSGGPAIPGEGGVLSGDSGGAFFHLDNGKYRVAGVTSFMADIVQGSQHPLDRFLDFGDQGGAADLFTYHQWVYNNSEAVPEPATMMALGAGLAALAARRRKKNA